MQPGWTLVNPAQQQALPVSSHFIMNIFQKLFGRKRKGASTNGNHSTASPDTIKTIEDNTEKLWKFIEETMVYYNSISCQCAFPRYRQIVSLDCVDYKKSFYSSETQGFIQHSRPYFNMIEGDNKQEDNSQFWTCKKCGSVYDYAYSGFSIYVNRGYLKIKEHKILDIGAEPLNPTPFFVGLFGHSYPDRALFKQVDFDTFSSYVRQTKNGY